MKKTMMKKLSIFLTIPLFLSGCLSPSEKPPWNREVVLAPSAFKQVALPKADSFLARHDPFAFPVAISSNGTPTICGNIATLPALGAIITKATMDPPNEIHVQVGADATTPFDRIWPVLDVCSASGISCVGFAVSKGDQECMNILPAYIPKIEANLPDKANFAAAVINVQTNGFIIGKLKNCRVTDAQRIETANAPEQLCHLYLGHRLADDDESQTVFIVPSKGTTHAQVAEVIYWCWGRGLGNLSLVRQDQMPAIDANAPAFHYDD